MKLPSPLKTLLVELKKQDTCTTELCKTCEGYKYNHCCTRPGFQTFENTVLIYEKYYMDISYKTFIDTYYTPPVFQYTNNQMVIFYPKVNKSLNESMPNAGCVFLKRKLDGTPGEQFMNCSLHDSKSYDELTTFPLGCITDSATPSPVEYHRFNEYRMSMINYFYPDSTKRFNAKYGVI